VAVTFANERFTARLGGKGRAGIPVLTEVILVRQSV
jgi:hypothetical protein